MVTRIFLSHSDQDRVYAHSIAERLRGWNFEVFVDFMREEGIRGGAQWEEELLSAIRRSRAVLICFTEAVSQSLWCFGEALVARYEGKPLIPLLLHGQPEVIWPFLLASTQYIDFRDDPDTGYERLATALKRVLPSDPSDEKPLRERAPFAGLRPLGEADADLFFGRDSDRDAILSRLRSPIAREDLRSICITGPSGSGKSSLLHAGIVPALRQGAVESSDRWAYLQLTPGSHPFRRMAEASRRLAPELGNTRSIVEGLERDPNGLGYLVSDVLAASDAPAVCVIIDQFEEILTQTAPEEQMAFLRALTQCEADVGSERLITLTTLRADFLVAMLETSATAGADIVRTPYVLTGLTQADLREVIEAPARRVGLTIDPGLVARLVSEAFAVGDPLPLLSFVLRQMYDRAAGRGTLDEELYAAAGGLEGAVAQHAEAVFTALRPEDQALMLETLVEKFLVVSADGVPTRRRVPRADIAPTASSGIEALVRQRIVVALADADGTPSLEVAHEAVFRHWPRLRDAIDLIDADVRYARRVLAAAVEAFDELGALPRAEEARLVFAHIDRIDLSAAEVALLLRLVLRTGMEKNWPIHAARDYPRELADAARQILSGTDSLTKYGLISYVATHGDSAPWLPNDTALTLASSPVEAVARAAARLLGELQVRDQFVDIPAGRWTIGPQGQPVDVETTAFSVGRYLVTNADYATFVVDAERERPAHWPRAESVADAVREIADLPVVYVSYFDALAFCEYKTAVDGVATRLLTEVEWEVALGAPAHCGSAPVFPWGDAFDPQLCNTGEGGAGRATPIGLYSPQGDTPHGIADLSGNVWEWTASPGRLPDGTELPYPDLDRAGHAVPDDQWCPRVQKGGTFLAGQEFARRDSRLVNLPDLRLQDFGFRVARGVG